eukprot:750434-Hanusia_phi.AAC.2
MQEEVAGSALSFLSLERRFLLPGWELTEDRCTEIEQEARAKLAGRNLEEGGGGGENFSALLSLDANWGFPNEEFAEETL